MLNISIPKKQLHGAMPLPIGNFSGECYAFTGMVTEVHPEDHTVHVRTKTGRVYSGLRVASLEWVTIDEEKDFLSGQRRLPPVNTYVLCLMQTDDPNTAIVLCSLFGIQVAEHAAFKEDEEYAAHIRKKITNSGWTFIEDNKTGTFKIYNKPTDLNPVIKCEIDFGTEEEPLDPPELHAHFFHDEENDNPGIKLDYISGNTIDLSVFKDIKLHHEKDGVITAGIFGEDLKLKHKKNDSIEIIAYDTKITIKKGLLQLEHKGDYITKVDGNIYTNATGDIISKAGGVNRSDGSITQHN